MRALAPALGVVVAACAPGQIVLPAPAPAEVPAVVRVEVAPTDGTRPLESTVMPSASAVGLSLVAGNVAVVGPDAVQVRAGMMMSPVPVGAAGMDALGTVRLIGRRGPSSLWLTSTGVYLERQGRLLRSPLSDSLPLDAVRAIDVVGEGASETWWVRTDDALLRVTAAGVDSIVLDDPRGGGALAAVVGRDGAVALVVRGERLYRLDVAGSTVAVLARGLGAVVQTARLGDGTAVFATADGLVRVSPGDEVRRLVFGAAATVQDVAADGDAALVQTNGKLLSVFEDEARVLSDVAAPVVSGVVRDGSGAVFTLDGAALKRLATTPEESPARYADVKPFFVAHCVGCHRSGANYAPLIDFATYAKAKQWAAQSLARVLHTESPMPPAASGVLMPSQYAVLERWVAGGLLP